MNGGRRILSGAIGVLGALVLLFGAVPSRARASCGDYLVPMTGNHDLGTRSAVNRHLVPHTPPDRSHGPCSGPECSRRPAAPFAPAAPPRTSEHEWGTLVALAIPAAAPPGGFVADGTVPRPVRAAPSIYHPPR